MTAATLRASPIQRVMRGGVLVYVAFLVALPLLALASTGMRNGLDGVWRAVSSPTAADALLLTLWTGGLTAIVNAVTGTATAWVLVRFRFPGRSLLQSLVDLPFAVPTLITGVMLVLLLGPTRPLGRWFAANGIEVMFAPPAIIFALLFVTMPFVVRAVEPVLAELDPAEEEAARTLGAGDWVVVRRVILPALMPAIGVGALQSFARAIAEFGSIVVVSGNIPHKSLTGAIYIFGEVEGGRPDVAAAVSLVLLTLSFALSLGARALRHSLGNRRV
ncbi:MAG: sulfate ABC transporter permease subunit [Gemmatimonadota bacterium]